MPHWWHTPWCHNMFNGTKWRERPKIIEYDASGPNIHSRWCKLFKQPNGMVRTNQTPQQMLRKYDGANTCNQVHNGADMCNQVHNGANMCNQVHNGANMCNQVHACSTLLCREKKRSLNSIRRRTGSQCISSEVSIITCRISNFPGLASSCQLHFYRICFRIFDLLHFHYFRLMFLSFDTELIISSRIKKFPE